MACSCGKKLDVEVELKSPVDKFWNAIKDSSAFFPKAFPDLYKSIQVLEGDGKSVGSVRLINYVEGKSAITFAKEKVESVDEETKSLSYSVIDGDILKFYKSFKATLTVAPKGEGSLVKWSSYFEKACEDAPSPDLIKDFAVKNFQGLDAYLLTA